MSKVITLDPRGDKESASLVIRACDMCRKKKIRCEAISEICLQCIKNKTSCHFTPINMKRKPRRPLANSRVEKLETRLKWMESQLKRAVEHRDFEASVASKNKLTGLETQISDQFHIETSSPTSDSFDGVQLYPALSMAKVSPRVLDLEAPFERASFSYTPGIQIAISPWNLISVSNLYTTPGFKMLPPKSDLLALVEKSFRNFNSVLPIFDQAAFMRTFQNLDININVSDWWACLNVILALTNRFETTATHDAAEDNEALEFFQNALAVGSRLITMRPTLSAVQALLGMSIVMLGTPNHDPVSLLISSAIKLAQNMGLHRRYREPGLSKAEIEQRKRVFWIAYCLDKDLSLQTGQPPTQDEDDMDVELPFVDIEALNDPRKQKNADIFTFRIKLAIIQGQIYKQLCSVKASKQSIAERIRAAKELNTVLQSWRASVIMHFHSEDGTLSLPTTAASPSLPSIPLNLAYFNSLHIINGSLSMLSSYDKVQGNQDPIKVHIMLPSINYADEARRAMEILKIIPRRHYACVWAVLHIFVRATTSLLTQILRSPSEFLALADLKLIKPLLRMLYLLAKTSNSNVVVQMYRSCMELFEKARIAVRGYSPYEMNEQSRGRESLEDFLKRIERISAGDDVDQ